MKKMYYNDFYKKRVALYQNKIINNTVKLRRVIKCIKKSAERWGIDEEVLFGVISIEYVNRGNEFTVFLEKITSKICLPWLIKKDISLGMAQIRISTAKCFLKGCSEKSIVRKLLNEETNIDICAMLINSYIRLIKEREIKDEICALVKLYTTGKLGNEFSIVGNMYSDLLKWCITSKIFERIQKQEV